VTRLYEWLISVTLRGPTWTGQWSLNVRLFNSGLISKAYQATVETQSNAGAKHLLTKILKEDTVKALKSGKKNLADYDIPGANMDAFIKRLKEVNEDVFEIHRMFAKSLTGFQVGQNGVLLVSQKHIYLMKKIDRTLNTLVVKSVVQ